MRETEPSRIIAPELGAEIISGEKSLLAANIFSQLEGVRLDKKQKIAAAVIGEAERGFDSVFDKQDVQVARLRGEEILRVITEKGTGSPQLGSQLNRALLLAQENLNPEALTALADLTKAQIESIRQREKDVPLATIRDITKQKGGKAALMLALEVSPDMNMEKRKCYEELGFLVQLVDDFEDKEIDIKDGIVTIANSLSQPQVLSEIIQQAKKVKKLFEAQYEAYKLTEIFNFINRLLATIGILG